MGDLNRDEIRDHHELLDFHSNNRTFEMLSEELFGMDRLGVAQYSSGHFKEPKECLEKALQINRQYGLAWYNLGLVYFSLGYDRESKRCYDEAARSGKL